MRSQSVRVEFLGLPWLINTLAVEAADARRSRRARRSSPVPEGDWLASNEVAFGLWALVDVVKERLDADSRPDGYNVGFNADSAAGQTVEHLHIHVIPRHAGDVVAPAAAFAT